MISKEEAEGLKTALEAIGAEVEIKSLLNNSIIPDELNIISNKLEEIKEILEFLKTEEQVGILENTKDIIFSITTTPLSLYRSVRYLFGY